MPEKVAWKNGKDMGSLVNNSLRSIPKLNNDIHNDLKIITDMDKLINQNKLVADSLDIHQWLSIKNNISKINKLDNWLKYYFPNGCNWKNRPDDD